MHRYEIGITEHLNCFKKTKTRLLYLYKRH